MDHLETETSRHSSRNPVRRRSTALLVTLLALAMCSCLWTACVSRPAEPDLDMAVEIVAKDLASQLGFFRRNSILVVDPLLDGASGQQTSGTKTIEKRLGVALRKRASSVQVVSFDRQSEAEADLVATGTLVALEGANRYRMAVALSEKRTGLVVAQSAVQFRQAALDSSPTPFYRDSPSLVRDRSVDGYLRTSQTPAGNPADALYLDQLPTSALLAEALAAYNEEKWPEALERYEAAATRSDGQQLRTFNGLYLSNTRLRRGKDAEVAFSKIVDLGFSTNNLAVKLLFRPGTTEYWPDPQVSGVYPMWLRKIARAAAKSGICIDVVGHTSRSGSAALNQRLSLERAKAVREQLARHARGMLRRTRVTGVGFAENIVGNGADDVTDALDRRAEFRVLPCEELGLGEEAHLPSAPPLWWPSPGPQGPSGVVET